MYYSSIDKGGPEEKAQECLKSTDFVSKNRNTNDEKFSHDHNLYTQSATCKAAPPIPW